MFALCWSGMILSPALADPTEDFKLNFENQGADGATSLKASKAAIELFSDYIEAAVAQNGNFTIQTRIGDPANPLDNNKHILFGHPFPGSGGTTLRVDGTDYSNYGIEVNQIGQLVSGPSTSGDMNQTVWQAGDIRLTQTLQIVEGNSRLRDTLLMKYEILNTGAVSHETGLRIFLDTQLGANDGAPFQVPGLGFVVNERERLGADIPQFFLSFDQLANPAIQTQGTLIGAPSTVPDRVVWGNWGRMNNTLFDFTVAPQMSLLGDSAVGIYWNPATLAPGATRICASQYGLGSLQVTEGELVVGLAGPNRLSVLNGQWTPDPFSVIAFVGNPQSPPAPGSPEDVMAELILPGGLELAPGQSSTANLGPILPGNTRQTLWMVHPTSPQGGNFTYEVRVTRSGLDPVSATRSIEIPPLGISLHPGFEDGVFIGKGLVQSSISLADIDEDGLNELVVGSPDGSLYGYNGDGTPVIEGGILNPGALFTTPGKASIYSTPTTVDTDLDDRVDLLFGTDGGVVYHLELLLSSDIIDPATKTMKAVPEPYYRPSSREAPAQGEEDDTGG